jgi:hypothetical protein
MLDLMRCLTGIGGGGLITMGKDKHGTYGYAQLIKSAATVINSDIIPFKRRGMYQAAQNILVGFGAICGASFGGLIADTIGWRWCFLSQVPVSILAGVVGYLFVKSPDREYAVFSGGVTLKSLFAHVDVLGSLVLVIGLLVQLLGLSLGGNEIPWNHPFVIGSLVSSIALLAIFVAVETSTPAIPVIPMRMLRGRLPIFAQIANVFSGMAAYAVSSSSCAETRC